MSLPRLDHATHIADQLNELAAMVKTRSRASLTDANRLLETIATRFFNALFGWDLVNLNTDQANYPAADLGDRRRRIAIQVTNEDGSDKIKHSVAKAIEHQLGKDFDRLIVFFLLPKKPGFPKKFVQLTEGPKVETWDNADLLKQMLELPDPNALAKAAEVLDEEMGKFSVVITVLLPDDHKTFGQDKANNLRSILAHEAGVKPDQIVILRTRTGSTKVDVQLTEEAAKMLLGKYATGQGPLRDRGVIRIDAELPQEQGAKSVSVRILRTAPWALVGRDLELAQLDRIAVEGGVNVLTLVALGGEGKTSLVAAWMSRLAGVGWGRFEMVFDWSFYSQGAREQLAASSDLFLKEALTFFGDDADRQFAASAAGAFEKGQRLARLVGQRRSLLILDGLEPLQYALNSPTPGELKDQGVAALLKGLAVSSLGLCVVTTRYSLPDLKAFWQTTAREEKLLRLSRDAGTALLRSLGVNGTATELNRLVEEVKGHALTLTLLGGFLKRAFHGDIRQRDRVKFEKADENMDGGHAFRIMAAYEQWLLRGGDEGRREVAVLRLMGLFDRPADAGCLTALRSETIPSLTEPLVGLADDDWEFCLSGLETAKLVTVNRDAAGALVSLDAHPLLREYFARQLRANQPDAWRAAHRRLYEHLCRTTTDKKPNPTLEDLQPLYQAIVHGCLAELFQETLGQVYVPRIQRGNEFYVWRKLGAFGTDLGAISCFFEGSWTRPVSQISQENQAWILNIAAHALRALGRLRESLEAMRAGLDGACRLAEWVEASARASSLSELELVLGDVATALRDAERSVEFADRTGDSFWRRPMRAMLAYALHQAGRSNDALLHFREAEAFQVVDRPEYPLLASVWGFRFCDLLLAEVEQEAWKHFLNLEPLGHGVERKAELLRVSEEVEQRAVQMLNIAERNQWLLDIALDRLVLGRVSLYCAISGDSGLDSSSSLLDDAVQRLRAASAQEFIVRGLLTRAWVRSLRGARTSPESAQSDLDEAWEIAERGPMKLHMADIHLHRARLHFREKSYPWKSPQDDLTAAEKLINDCGYHRRDEELADAKRAILG